MHFAKFEKERKERIRKAGKHKCVKAYVGRAARMTTMGGRPLKRPVIIGKLYECKTCGKAMYDK